MKTTVIILAILVTLLYLRWVAILLLLPFQAAHAHVQKKGNTGSSLICRLLGKLYKQWEKPFHRGWSRYMLYQVGLVPSHHIRKWVYKALGAEIGRNAVFNFRTEIRSVHLLKVGAGSIIGDNVLLDARRGLNIGKNVNIATDVAIYSGAHNIRDPYFSPPPKCSNPVPIIIGDRVYIGARAMILNCVTIGEGAVLCAGCVVTKDVEPFAIMAGIPARKIGERPRDLRYEFKGKNKRLY